MVSFKPFVYLKHGLSDIPKIIFKIKLLVISKILILKQTKRCAIN